MTEQERKALIEEFKGHRGDRESETVIILNRADEEDGYITFWSNRGVHVARLLARAGSGVSSYGREGGGLWLSFRQEVVRSPELLLKNLDGPKRPMTEEQKARLRGDR